MGISIILTVLFGPLGMLYSTIAGGLIMMPTGFFLNLLGFGLTLPIGGLGVFLTWPITVIICVIWAAMATSSYNQKLLRGQRQY